eukprot:TRINITY_DN1365_c0_g1_i3.p1 TRINITY_DN1365_c0_g1~~TRINITY_DN1365_c0_g1_i3.p1  ORF type:complete len:236 (-),score=21.40 TRINITY_DN1365_c0_g1_i3:293-1000(-)
MCIRDSPWIYLKTNFYMALSTKEYCFNHTKRRFAVERKESKQSKDQAFTTRLLLACDCFFLILANQRLANVVPTVLEGIVIRVDESDDLIEITEVLENSVLEDNVEFMLNSNKQSSLLQAIQSQIRIHLIFPLKFLEIDLIEMGQHFHDSCLNLVSVEKSSIMIGTLLQRDHSLFVNKSGVVISLTLSDWVGVLVLGDRIEVILVFFTAPGKGCSFAYGGIVSNMKFGVVKNKHK